jgi:hypothetical protein
MAAFVAIAAIGFTFDRSLNWLRQKVIYWQADAPSLT